MAGEIQYIDEIGHNVYALIFDLSGQVWNTATLAFESLSADNWPLYAIFLHDNSGTGIYVGDFPAEITIAGDYGIVVYEMKSIESPGIGDAMPAVGDLVVSGNNNTMHWDGEKEVPIMDLGGGLTEDQLYDSFVVNTTTFRSVMQGLAAVNLGNLTEDADHANSSFSDVNDPTTLRVMSANSTTTRQTTLSQTSSNGKR